MKPQVVNAPNTMLTLGILKNATKYHICITCLKSVLPRILSYIVHYVEENETNNNLSCYKNINRKYCKNYS